MTKGRTIGTRYYYWTIDREMFRLLIQRRGFSPYSLAREAGVDKRIIYLLLNGKRRSATYPTAEAIARALDIDLALFADPSMPWAPMNADMLKSG